IFFQAEDGIRCPLVTGVQTCALPIFSTVSNRLNAVMKQLAVIATIFLPLSWLTGFFGQNFGWLTGQIGRWQAFVGVGVGTELVEVGRASCRVRVWMSF